MGRTGHRGMGFRAANYKQIRGYPLEWQLSRKGVFERPKFRICGNLALQVMLLSDALPKQSRRPICS